MRFVGAVAALVASTSAIVSVLPVASQARIAPLRRTVLPGNSSVPLVYAVNQYGFSVTAFRQSANGNVAPVVDISGSQTKIYQPRGFAVSRDGTVAVADSQSGETPEIAEYASGANGNVAPIRTITCGPSGYQEVPDQIAFDEHGNLYAKYYMGHKAPSDAIEVYKPSQQSGCTSVRHVLFGSQTAITTFGGITVARGVLYSAGGGGVQEFHTSDTGNVAPFNVVDISGSSGDVNGLAVDKRGYLYVANGNEVLVFAPGATGSATPVAVISGDNTQIPLPGSGIGALGVAVGRDGRIFVGVQYDTSASSILEFAAGSNGNVAPQRIVTGSNTGLSWISEMGVLE